MDRETTKKDGSSVSWTELKHIQVQEGFNLRGKVKADPDLVERVKKSGVLHPIHIRRSPEGTHFLLVDGERRYRAAEAAGLELIPVVLHEDMSDEEALLFSFRANEAQKPWTKGQKFKMFMRLSEMGWTTDQMGAALLVSHKTVLEYLKTNEKGSAATKKALADGEVSSRVSSRVANLPKNKQGAVLARIKGKGSKGAVQEVRKEEESEGVVLPGPKPRAYPLVDDVGGMCRQLERCIREQLDLAPHHKVLLGQLKLLEVVKGKRAPEDLFPELAPDMTLQRRGHGG